MRVKSHPGATPRRGSRRPNEHRRILQRQAALYEISEAAHQAEDLEALFGRLHVIVARLMPAENIYIALYDPATDQVSYPYYVDQVDAPPLGPEPLGRGLTSYVLRTGQPLLATAEVFERMLRAGEVESIGAPSLDWLGVPLRVRDRTIGVMAIQTYSESVRYGEAERDLLVYVSNHVAQAIERKGADWAIHESQRQLATLMSNLPGMAYRCRNDTSWTMELLSEGCQALTGYTPAQLLGNATISYDDVVHPLDRAKLHREVEEALAGERPYEFTYRIVTADGQTKWVWERGRGVFGPTGELLALEGFIADVTATREATEALRQSEERYRLALQATQEVMYDWDMRAGTLVWNRAVTRVLGWDLEEFGDTLDAWSGFIHPEDRGARRRRARRRHRLGRGVRPRSTASVASPATGRSSSTGGLSCTTRRERPCAWSGPCRTSRRDAPSSCSSSRLSAWRPWASSPGASPTTSTTSSRQSWARPSSPSNCSPPTTWPSTSSPPSTAPPSAPPS